MCWWSYSSLQRRFAIVMGSSKYSRSGVLSNRKLLLSSARSVLMYVTPSAFFVCDESREMNDNAIGAIDDDAFLGLGSLQTL